MALTQRDVKFIADLILRRAAIVLDERKDYLVEARLARVAQQLGVKNTEDLVYRLRNSPSPDLERRIIDAMTTNETYFFRDNDFYDDLRKVIIPGLIKSREATKTLNIWCAACSTGQEPYSVLMLLRTQFPELNHWRLRFIASDLATTVLATAKAGRYNQIEINRGLPKAMLDKFFTKEPSGSWVINEDLRRMIEFRPVNLIEAFTHFPKLDLVFLRNVLIYFSSDTKRSIMSKMGELIHPDGLLFLGKAESTLTISDVFERKLVGQSFAYGLRAVKK